MSIGLPNVRLLGCFALIDGPDEISLSSDARRLIAYLAVRGERLPRPVVAGSLWGDRTATQAAGSLRSALWRVRRDCPGLIEIDDRSLQLTPSAATDLKYLEAASLFVEDEVRTPRLMQWDHRVLGRELLPSWYDEWVVVARERVRQLSLHTLESLADRLCADHRFASAVQSALGAIRLDPFRESARRALIRIHLAEGNHAEALRVHDEYADLLQAELGLHPSDRMAELMCRVHRSA